MTASTKGATVRGTLAFVEHLQGPVGVQTVLGALPAELAHTLHDVRATDDVPYTHLLQLWDAVEQVLGTSQPTWAKDAGGFNIESLGVQLYGGILSKPTPKDFLTQSVSLFRLFYAPGDMTVVQEADGMAVLRLVGFNPVSRVFCERQVGGLTQALALAGGQTPVVQHVRCTLDGDAFCEWEMRWTERAVPSAT